MPDRKGFTLIEMIVVLIIVAILAVFSIPVYTNSLQHGAAEAAENNLITIYNAEKSYYFVNSVYCTATTGAVSPCGDNLTDINSNLATLNQTSPTITSLNITDTSFTYACSNTGGFQCTATNILDTHLILTLSNSSIVLPGSSSTLNPSCATDVTVYCPT